MTAENKTTTTTQPTHPHAHREIYEPAARLSAVVSQSGVNPKGAAREI